MRTLREEVRTAVRWIHHGATPVVAAAAAVTVIVAVVSPAALPVVVVSMLVVSAAAMVMGRVRSGGGQLGRYAETWTSQHGGLASSFATERTRSEPLPATVGSGQNSLVIMYWNRWGKTIWARYGAALLGREAALDAWAEKRDYSVLRPAAPDVLTGGNAVPALFLDDARPSIIYPRNRIAMDLGKHRLILVDANRYLLPDSEHGAALRLIPTTAILTQFPEGQSMIVTPHSTEQLELWLGFAGMKALTGVPDFDKKYDVYTSDADFALAVLTEPLMDEISLWDNVRIVSDRGVLVVAQPGEWTEPKDLDGLVALTRAVSRSGMRNGDAHLRPPLS